MFQMNLNTIESCYQLHQLVLELNQLSGDEQNATWQETCEFAIIEYLPFGQINFTMRGSRATLRLVGKHLGFDTEHRDFIQKSGQPFRNYTLTKQRPQVLTEEHTDVFVIDNMMPIRVTKNHLKEGYAIMLFRAGSKDTTPDCYIDGRVEIVKLPQNLSPIFLFALIASLERQVLKISGSALMQTKSRRAKQLKMCQRDGHYLLAQCPSLDVFFNC